MSGDAMRTSAKIVLALLVVSLATPAFAGGYHHHRRYYGHGHHHGGHHHTDYGALLGAVGAGVLVYTVGRIHGSRAHDRRNDSPAPVAYPAHGQSNDAQDRDRYECHRWAVREADFDPTRDRRGDRDLYNRAMTACLEARGYVVR
jgi:hypothetical protein